VSRKMKEIAGIILAGIFILVPAVIGALMFVWDFIESLPHLLGLYIAIFIFLVVPLLALYFAIDWFLKYQRQKRMAEMNRKFEEIILGHRKFGGYK